LGCIRGLEFVIQAEEIEEAEAFKELACRLVSMLPAGKLRRFAIDCGEFHGHRAKIFGPIVAETLQKSPETLEFLHLPCMGHPDLSSTEDPLYRAVSASTLQLRTISITGGNWNSCREITEMSIDRIILTAMKKSAGSVRTLLINCNYFSTDYDKQLYDFLASAIQLDTVHVVAGSKTGVLAHGLDKFLKEVPVLRHLLITPSS